MSWHKGYARCGRSWPFLFIQTNGRKDYGLGVFLPNGVSWPIGRCHTKNRKGWGWYYFWDTGEFWKKSGKRKWNRPFTISECSEWNKGHYQVLVPDEHYKKSRLPILSKWCAWWLWKAAVFQISPGNRESWLFLRWCWIPGRYWITVKGVRN